jgi:hypothetical protein
MADTPEVLETRLRERLEMAGCFVEKRDSTGEIWFTPHRNRRFRVDPPVRSGIEANAILRLAGMEEAF